MQKHVPISEVEQAPDWFTGISVPVAQMVDDYTNELRPRLQRLRTAHEAKNASAMKLAAEDLAKFLGGMSSVSDSIARAAITHLNRRPRP